jgi:coenzyme F420-reducing hydrogenase alpha subunit
MKIENLLWIFILFSLVACKNVQVEEDSEILTEVRQLQSIEAKKNYLDKIYEDDQSVRGSKGQELMLKFGKDSEEYMDYIKAQWMQDEMNLEKVEAYLKVFGYPKKEEVGENAALAPWLVIHHSTDLEARNRNFKDLYEAYLTKKIDDNAMSFYLNRTYQFTFKERMKIESPFKSEDEINQLIKALDLSIN